MPRILEAVTATSTPTPAPARPPLAPPLDAPACTWSSALLNTYLAGCEQGCESFATVAAAQAACAADSNCGGVTVPGGGGRPQLRAGTTPMPSPDNETSYVITNSALCHPIVPDSQWILRGAAAYEGLNRTDPLAVWSFQGSVPPPPFRELHSLPLSLSSSNCSVSLPLSLSPRAQVGDHRLGFHSAGVGVPGVR